METRNDFDLVPSDSLRNSTGAEMRDLGDPFDREEY